MLAAVNAEPYVMSAIQKTIMNDITLCKEYIEEAVDL